MISHKILGNYLLSINRKTILFAIILIVCLNFSIPVHADDNIKITGDIIHIILPVSAGTMIVCNKDHEGAIQFSKSFLTTIVITYALKYFINEKRPNGGVHSFPSGHTSEAFSAASFLQRRYGWKYGIPAYVAASFVGYSRIESHNHYVHDVLAGAAIGIVSTYIFTNTYKKGIVATPFVGKETFGLDLNATF